LVKVPCPVVAISVLLIVERSKDVPACAQFSCEDCG
jgi:hypothetical protein